MNILSKDLPDLPNIARCMPDDVAPAVIRDNEGRAQKINLSAIQRTMREVAGDEAHFEGLESEMHQIFENWCRTKDILPVHCRMDRKSTIEKGAFDFFLLKNGWGCAVELKSGNNGLSDDQKRYQEKLKLCGVPADWFPNTEGAIRFVKTHLHLE